MPKIPLDFASDTYVSTSSAQAKRRCINWYKHIDDGEALSKSILVGCPGLSSFATVDYPICRGFIEIQGRAFAVYANKFYEIFTGGTVTDRSTIDLGNNSDNNIVRMATNGLVIIIITDNNGYYYNLSTNILAEIVDATFSLFGTVIDVSYKDGKFNYLGTDYAFQGSLATVNNGMTFDPLAFGSAEIEPDSNVGQGMLNNQLLIFGTHTAEWFESVQETGYTLQRIQGATIQKGCVARNTIVNFQSALSFLGNDRGESPALWLVQGSNTVKISTPAIDNYIQGLTEAQWEDAFCWTYQQGGSNFLVFDIGDATFVYDATTSEKAGRRIWHERQSGDIDWINYKTWTARLSVQAFGKTLVGDKTSTTIGQIGYETYTEYGDRIPKGIQSQPFDAEYNAVSEIEVFVESGVGTATISPRLLLSYSEDQSVTFTNPVGRDIGDAGDYTSRLKWRRLKRITRPRTFRLYSDDSVKMRILKIEGVIE